MRKLILASCSPRRKELLQEIVKSFRVFPSKYEEDMTLNMLPERLAIHLSEGKAKDVATHFPDAIILAADSFIVLGVRVLGKPKDLAHARRMLSLLRGKAHDVVTGLTLLDSATNKKLQKAVVTKVVMKNFTNEQIEKYITTHDVLDKAGSYAIQEIGDNFIDHIEGSESNIIGLPLKETKEALEEFGAI